MINLLRSGLIVVIAVFMIQLLIPNSQAQSWSEQIEALKRQMEEIQRQSQQQIEELRTKIEELEAQKDTDQKKIEELEVKKEEEDEDARWKKIDAGYKDGLFFKTKDGNFSMKMNLYGQTQLSISDIEDEDTATNFDIRRLRLIWRGNAFRPWLLYYAQIDATEDIILRDAYFDAAYSTKFAPRAGQYKVPFSREQLYSGSSLQLVERSILDEEFRFGRDVGAGVYGVLGTFIAYGVGVFNGNGRNADSFDSNLLYAGRVEFTPCCGALEYKQSSFPVGGDYELVSNFGGDVPIISIGLAVAEIPGLDIANKTPENDLDERFEEIFGLDAGDITERADVIEVTADAVFKYKIFNIEGDYFLRRIDPDGGFEEATDQGFRVQSGISIIPEFIEAAGRFALIDYDNDIDGRDLAYEITPGVNFYLSRSHRYKLQFSYSFIRDEDTDGAETDENVLRAQLQVYF